MRSGLVSRTLTLSLGIIIVAAAGCEGDHAGKAAGDPASPPGASAPGPGAGSPPAPSPGPSTGAGTGGSGGGATSTPGSGGAAGGSGAPGSSPGSPPPPSPGPRPSPPGQPPQSGLLTAGTWDDNLNFDFYLKYHQRMRGMQLGGLPPLPVDDRLVVTVTDRDGKPLAGAQVIVRVEQRELARTVTGAEGRALVFPGWAGAAAGTALDITAETAEGSATVRAQAGDRGALLALAPAVSRPPVALDLALVIDTTGSMSDEILYLSTEMKTIASTIKAAFPNVDQRWALVAYRDVGDEYVTRSTDFTGDIEAYRSSIAALRADGGGDYPEAPDRALADMAKLGWRTGPVARVAFLVADAPHHVGNEGALVKAIGESYRRGIHLYPVAASGTDKLAEFSMRLAALATGGRYLFLTDDSGVGNAHMEPTIPCYFVTSLQKAMVRMIGTELSGQRIDPEATDVIRTGGMPEAGRCTLAGGEVVSSF
jgi:hypothetical protein